MADTVFRSKIEALVTKPAEVAGLPEPYKTQVEGALRGMQSYLRAALDAPPERLLAKHQPCGCVTCTCRNEDEPDRCLGCGARTCGTPECVFKGSGTPAYDALPAPSPLSAPATTAPALTCGCVPCVCNDEERCHGCGGHESEACQRSRLAGGPRHVAPTPPVPATTAPRCKTCGDAGYVMAYDQIEPGISVPAGEPCPDCDGPPAPAPTAPATTAPETETARAPRVVIASAIPTEELADFIRSHRASSPSATSDAPCPHCGGVVGEVNGGEGYWYPRRDCQSCGLDTTKPRPAAPSPRDEGDEALGAVVAGGEAEAHAVARAEAAEAKLAEAERAHRAHESGQAALERRIKAWEDRFRALVGEDRDDAAGNAVIRLRSELEAAKTRADAAEAGLARAQRLVKKWEEEATRYAVIARDSTISSARRSAQQLLTDRQERAAELTAAIRAP